ncbi:hypothetical protein [Nocardia sp. NPDC060259]|uniref:hypothetical protein n=1 Tax=Nocardia sp. NPDC060259 TaxID=3347088 RepID=UPI00364CE4E7
MFNSIVRLRASGPPRGDRGPAQRRRLRTGLAAAPAIVSVALGGCGSGTDAVGLDDYVRSECEIAVRYQARTHELVRRILETAGPATQTRLADIAAEMARLFDELAEESEKLGEPPNGETTGNAKQALAEMRQTSTELADSATRFRSATSADELTAALDNFQQVLTRAGTRGRELRQQEASTPELDEARKAIPGCEDAIHSGSQNQTVPIR